MSLKDQLKTDMKEAMKAREAGKVALSVIRMVNSAIRNTEINEKIELDDDGVITILAKEMKSRHDSLAEFKKGGREDLVLQTQAEMDVLANYLPKQLEEEEIRKIVAEAILACGDDVNMGNVMRHVMPSTKGKADGKLVSDIVKEMLAK
ncbi:aspartyl-tRNA amidotransferase [Veillonella montpellierensis DNF00314]|uniref:Aspartyl-tRNA amidotransferase n=1 Tax=Veillonella montpellierensis DNF00314 TaxID=1401067 RepID=A0A096ALP1_9FIRM|nr:GatB/YqeY domain-containing protein [Veillonella montpellierensis]KGF48003.1 aspartyl-tRNA amidotransferase [Veillonella montpellierensis DNF00314]